MERLDMEAYNRWNSNFSEHEQQDQSFFEHSAIIQIAPPIDNQRLVRGRALS